MTVVEEDEGSAAPQILPAFLTFRYLLMFWEGEIMYLSASLAVVEEEIDMWGKGVERKGQTASLHHHYPDHMGDFLASGWTAASVANVTRTSISLPGRGIPRWKKIRRHRRRGVLTYSPMYILLISCHAYSDETTVPQAFPPNVTHSTQSSLESKMH